MSGHCRNKDVIKNSKIETSPGCADPQCASKDGFDDAVKLVKSMYAQGKLSFVVLGLGLDESIEKESHDRSTIELPGHQNALVSALYDYTKSVEIPIICYLIHGGSLALGSAYEECAAILDVWYPGQMGAYGFSDVVFGVVNPAGRASVTSYTSTAVLPPMGDMNLYPSDGHKGITYRYVDDADAVLVPFGFELSYTRFSYSNLSLNVSGSAGAGYTLSDPCGAIAVEFVVSNVGQVAGDEVVQLYVKQPEATVPVPRIRLGDFERVEAIAAGHSQKVKLVLTPRYRTSVMNASSKVWFQPDIRVEKGVVQLFVGGGQPDMPFKGYLSANVTVQQAASFADCENQD